jgi:hypothetical protein
MTFLPLTAEQPVSVALSSCFGRIKRATQHVNRVRRASVCPRRPQSPRAGLSDCAPASTTSRIRTIAACSEQSEGMAHQMVRISRAYLVKGGSCSQALDHISVSQASRRAGGRCLRSLLAHRRTHFYNALATAPRDSRANIPAFWTEFHSGRQPFLQEECPR